MNQLFSSFFLIFLFIGGSFAQEVSQQDSIQPLVNESFVKWENDFIALGETLLKDTIASNRQKAAQDLKKGLQEMLTQKETFAYPFDSLQSVSILYPADSTFRILTWQLYEDINTYTYFGIIQTNSDSPVVHVLKDQSGEIEELETDIVEADSWYGALYYNVKEFEGKEGKYYLLFGFDSYEFFNKRKLIDVLTFEEGQPIFGAPVFEPTEPNRPDLTKSRLVLTYSAETTIRLNYDESLNVIIMPNLMPGSGPLKGQIAMLPDGSYKGYKLDGNRWAYVDKIFDHVYEKAPTPAPILHKRKGKDIFGNR